jgi:hypothetical protein
MKKRYIISIILIVVIFTSFNIYYKKFISIQGNNGYTFKNVGRNIYKVTDGDNYIGSICDFTIGGQLLFQNKTFTYELNGYKGDYTLEIRYPDGDLTNYSDKTHGSIGSKTEYDTDFLMSVITAIKLTPAPQIIFIHLIIAIIALGMLISPKGVFEITCGWIYKNSEPTDIYLAITRIIGIILILYVIYQINFAM